MRTIIASIVILVGASAFAQQTNTLDSLRQSYETRQRSILAQYGKALDTIMADVKKKGDLDSVLVLQTEQQRFNAEKTVLDPKDAKPPLSLASQAHCQAMVALLGQYAAGLDSLIKKEVAADRIEEAKAVKAEKDKIALILTEMQSKLPAKSQAVTPQSANSRPPTPNPTFKDDFGRGISMADWATMKTDASYQLTTRGGSVHLSTPRVRGGGRQCAGLQFKHKIRGDFVISVKYSNARIKRVNGAPANQVQLNAKFGGQLFCVVRDDDMGQGNNYHVFTGAPWQGVKTDATAGELAIVREGKTVSGHADGLRLWQGTFNAEPVTQVELILQNNGTTDPISVTFDDFAVTAESVDRR